MKKIIPWLISIVLAFFLFQQMKIKSNNRKSAENTIDFLQDSTTYYKNKLNKVVSVNAALKGYKSKLNLLLSKTSYQLKELQKKFDKVKVAGEIRQEVFIDTIKHTYTDTIPFVFSRDFSVHNKYYSYDMEVSQMGYKMTNLNIPNTLDFVIGEKKDRWLIETLNSNEYITTQGAKSVTIMKDTNRFGYGAYAGVGIGSNFSISPQIGVGVFWALGYF